MNATIAAGLKYFLKFLLIYVALTSISLIPSVTRSCNQFYQQPTGRIVKWLFPKAYIQLKTLKDEPQITQKEIANRVFKDYASIVFLLILMKL